MIDSAYKDNHRRQMRYDLTSRIRCFMLSHPDEEMEGITLNISISGLCIDIDRPVLPGQYITVAKCILPYFQEVFSVRWVEKVDSPFYDRYRVGLQFRSASQFL